MDYSSFNKSETLHRVAHYLPAQAPLKDFIHHNTLHAFQSEKFEKALNDASRFYGYQTFLQIEDYQRMFSEGKIESEAIYHGLEGHELEEWRNRLFRKDYDENVTAEIGQLRNIWKDRYRIDLDSMVFPLLFRTVLSYLDQGIAVWQFPVDSHGFIASLKKLESCNATSIFKTSRPRQLLLSEGLQLEALLTIVVGEPRYFERYLFDQQFAHPGYSGMVSVIESNPGFLVDQRNLTLEDFILFELLLEIDVLDYTFGTIWSPLSTQAQHLSPQLTYSFEINEVFEVKIRWHQAFEWTYYDAVLKGIAQNPHVETPLKTFQSIFCIDDRECSLRRNLELVNAAVETYGTAGFFNAEFYFQPANSELRMKVCPAPLTPKYLIKETVETHVKRNEFHLNKGVNGLVQGWFFTQTMGFLSAIRLVGALFFPKANAFAVSSNRHMYKDSFLSYEHEGNYASDGIQIGYTLEEMANRLYGLLMSIGLTKDFAPIVYIVGHGSSSANNTHYAGYDCGACSGRPGSVNARVMAKIANRVEVRELLKEKGVLIPDDIVFIASLHDTSRDEMTFYDVDHLKDAAQALHLGNVKDFKQALALNASERSRRFVTVSNTGNLARTHAKVKLRSVSLFEPRPELNHATNALCIVGPRRLSRGLFLDRRAFLNSYDYRIDLEGTFLTGILNAIAPVCGGINLEYFFSRVDNNNLGAGTKLPHNVMGLIGVANGIDGDLRTGLPNQMIEVHDPIRLLAIVEHFPKVVLEVLQKNPKTYEWFANEWVHLVVFHPTEKVFYRLHGNQFLPYETSEGKVKHGDLALKKIMHDLEDLPIQIIQKLVV
jgi:uncharacterized protein YbcC (UPF0753/DUF2309 family)